MPCETFDDGNGVRGIMCRRGDPKPRQRPDAIVAAIPDPDLRPGFPVGQKVTHKILGDGEVIRRRGTPGDPSDVAEIEFENHGRKEFSLVFAARNLKPRAAAAYPNA